MINPLFSKRKCVNVTFLPLNFPEKFVFKTILFSCALLLLLSNSNAQSLTISNAGQTGTSGTNWTTTGTNPVTITVTGTASINTSVIVGYLNTGTSVIVNNNTTAGTTINSSINKTTGNNASLTFKDIGCIKVADNVSISSISNMLDIILWADINSSQGGAVDNFIYCGIGTSFSSNGGKIVMAGGPDDGSNAGVSGDGIPDGFAWNGSSNSTYGANVIGGLTFGPLSGTGTVVSLQSNNGAIILYGASSNNCNRPGITSQGNLKIDAGSGKITMLGKSSTGHGIELTYGAAPAVAITSSSALTPAIDIKGITTASGYSGFWASNNATGNILIQSTAASNGGISIEGTSTGNIGIWLGTTGTSITSQVLSQSGSITLRGKGISNNSLLLSGDVYIGNRKDATTVQGVTPSVTASTANILIQADDQYQFSTTSGKNTNFSSTGSLTLKAYTAGYTGTLSWTGNTVIGSGFNSIILGDSLENYSFTVNNTLTAAGGITAYTNNFTLADGIGLVSSVAGNININARTNFATSGSTRRTISTVNGNINIFADWDANAVGQLDIDYTTFNPGTGNTKLRTETMSWVTTNTTDRPYFNGTGTVTIEPAAAYFQDVNTIWFVFDQDANGMAGLTIGKSTNTGNIVHQTTPITVAGPIALYGGTVTLSANLTSSATGDIFIKSNNTANGAASIAGNASILKTAGTGTLTMQSQDRLNSGTITASGTGVLNVVLWSDYVNNNNGGVAISAVTTNGGNLWLGGSNSNGGSYTWNGLIVGDGPSVGSTNNNYNAIDFYGPVSTNGGNVLIWGGAGYSSGISGIGVYSGASINSGSGDITLIADNISLNDLTITSTGTLSLVPDGGSYPSAITWSGTITGGNFNGSSTYDALFINNFASLGGLVIGYYNGHLLSGTPVLQGNTSNITVGSVTSIAGPITLYGTGLTVNQNLASSAGGNITLYSNGFSIAGSATLSSTGILDIEPITAGTTIGLAGGAGTLAVTAANFSTNFVDGFSEIRIGNSSSGTVTLGSVATVQDNLRINTSANFALNETMDIGNNNLRFTGNNIVPASNKFIKTNGTGKLYMNIGNNSSKLFPLGISYYNPVTITNHTSVSDTFYATVSNNVYTNGGTSGNAVSFSPRINLTWNIGNTGASTGAGSVDLAFGWNAANGTGSLANPRLLHNDGTFWTQQPGTPVFDIAAGTLTYTGYTGNFSPFGIAEANITLPVSYTSFTAKNVNNTVTLDWSTATEQNNDYFEVERSASGISFTVIGRVATKQPNTSQESKYQYIDYKPLAGHSYYRLKQVDVDGKSSYSVILSINISDVQAYSSIAIPGSNQLQLFIPQSVTAKTDLLMYDAAGRQMLRQQLQPGRSVIKTGLLTTGGVYFIKVIQADKLMYSKSFIN